MREIEMRNVWTETDRLRTWRERWRYAFLFAFATNIGSILWYFFGTDILAIIASTCLAMAIVFLSFRIDPL